MVQGVNVVVFSSSISVGVVVDDEVLIVAGSTRDRFASTYAMLELYEGLVGGRVVPDIFFWVLVLMSHFFFVDISSSSLLVVGNSRRM